MNHHFLAYCLSTPWAMRQDRMNAYARVLLSRYAAKDGVVVAFDKPNVEPLAGPRSSGARSGSIAVIPVYGAIVQHASQVDICDGGTSTDAISAALNDALNDETVSQILLDIDSPGGSVYGTGELAAEIKAARAQKPVVAFANSLAASAAYWIGASASEFYMTPGGEVGSIGVWMAHENWSKAIADSGVEVSLISAGKYKTEGNPYGPLDADARGFLQERVDAYYADFTKGVASGRNVPIEQVRSGMGQGRCLGATEAIAAGMVDGAKTFAEVVRGMQRSAKASAAPRGRSALAASRNALTLALAS
jgi:signal peptide peptidase SppA